MPFPLSEAMIAETEMALARRLPEKLRMRLSLQNGGELLVVDERWTLHPVRDGSDKKRLSRTSNDIIRETKMAHEWDGFPPEAVVIASNGTGDHIVLLPGSDNFHHWDHETGNLSTINPDWN